MENLILIAVLVLALAAWWVYIPARAVLNDRKLGILSQKACQAPDRWPRVSVLVPARNEESTITAAVQSLLQVDYPELEIILVNDRSSDRTGEIVDRLAAGDARIRPLHIEDLPAGWLGKVHALHQGIGISRGEWLLFTDADIHFAPETLKRAVAYCLQHQRGFLALIPRFRKTGLLVGATQATIGAMRLSLLDFARISDPDSPAAMGIGAFNLADRAYFDADKGLEWLRMEVADDAGLALMMKRRGARIDILSGQALIEVDWYPTLPAMFDGVMQRFIMGAHYHLGVYLAQCLVSIFCLLTPIGLGWLLASEVPLAWLSLGAYALPSLILGFGLRHTEVTRRLLWALPLGYPVIAYGMLRSLVTCLCRGGIYWRGSVYPLRELRASQRVRMSSFIG